MSKKTFLRTGLSTVPLAVLVACGGGADIGGSPTEAAAGKPTTSSSTGQGIWVNATGGGDYSIQQTNVYKFNVDAAAGYYSNAVLSGPVVACTGSPTACGLPDPSGVPAVPPAADPAQLTNVANGTAYAERCTFLSGGPLSGTKTYTQTITHSASSPTRQYKYTWTYQVLPLSSDPVAALTAWDLFNSSGDSTAAVSIGADIAGQSVVKNASNGTKYSWSLRDDLGLSRITNLVVTMSDGSTSTPYSTDSTLAENAPGALAGDAGAVDFVHTTNAGSNGDTSLLLNGDARSILNGVIGLDTFAGNNNGGADGKALAKAVMTPVTVNLAPGTYTATLTGTVKGNAALLGLDFKVQQTLNIVGASCGAQ